MKKDRVLLLAIIFSVVWHLFWISSLTVVAAPHDARPPKFSDISFLGPILGQSVFGLSATTHERSIPEKRYLSEIANLSVLSMGNLEKDFYIEADMASGTDIFESDDILTNLAMSAIDGNKMEPGNFQ